MPESTDKDSVIRAQVEAGIFAIQEVDINGALLWVSADAPVLGVVKAETNDWTMELISIENASEDLFPNKPAPGGVVYLNEE